jgi:hypothetical protein
MTLIRYKLLTYFLFLLFIGLAIAPSINFNAAKASDDLVEVTSQACGIKGFGDTPVKLTKEQYQDLEQYLVDFRAKLNQTTTREEAIPIFKDAVVELNKYGLLPKGMNVECAQRLMTRGNQIRNIASFLKKPISESINVFCLFTAITYDVVDLNVWLLMYFLLSQYIPYNSPLALLYYFFFLYGFLKPLCFCNFLTVSYGGKFIFYSSIGLKGIKSGMNDVSAVIGFTGLKIWFNTNNAFYLGVALSVNS